MIATLRQPENEINKAGASFPAAISLPLSVPLRSALYRNPLPLSSLLQHFFPVLNVFSSHARDVANVLFSSRLYQVALKGSFTIWFVHSRLLHVQTVVIKLHVVRVDGVADEISFPKKGNQIKRSNSSTKKVECNLKNKKGSIGASQPGINFDKSFILAWINL